MKVLVLIDSLCHNELTEKTILFNIGIKIRLCCVFNLLPKNPHGPLLHTLHHLLGLFDTFHQNVCLKTRWILLYLCNILRKQAKI